MKIDTAYLDQRDRFSPEISHLLITEMNRLQAALAVLGDGIDSEDATEVNRAISWTANELINTNVWIITKLEFTAFLAMVDGNSEFSRIVHKLHALIHATMNTAEIVKLIGEKLGVTPVPSNEPSKSYGESVIRAIKEHPILIVWYTVSMMDMTLCNTEWSGVNE